MGNRHFGHVGDEESKRALEEAVGKAPRFTQEEVNYLKSVFPISLAATPQSMDEALAISHNCAKAEGIEAVINHMQAIIDARKPDQ